MTHQVDKFPREIQRVHATLPPAAPGNSRAGEPAPQADGSRNGDVPALWQALIINADVADRAARLRTADENGVLYTHRLPIAAAPASAIPLHGLRTILNGGAHPIGPPTTLAHTLTIHDCDLDDAQRELVRRAVAGPDLYLIHGAAGTGKSRVLVELIRQAALLGKRILFTSAHPIALDAALERLVEDEHVLTIRWLAPREEPAKLPPSIRALTLHEQTERHSKRTQAHAAKAADDAQARVRSAEQQAHLLDELRSSAVQWRQLRDQIDELNGRRQSIADHVREAAEGVARSGGFDAGVLKQLGEERERHLVTVRELESKQEQARRLNAERQHEFALWSARVSDQARVVDVKRHKRIFTWTWWRTLFQGRVAERMTEFVSRQAEAKRAADESDAVRLDAEDQHAREMQRHTAALDQIVAGEIHRRQSELDRHLAELGKQFHAAESMWNAKRKALLTPTALSAMPDEAAIEACRAEIQIGAVEARRHAESAAQWHKAQREWCADLSLRLPELAHAIAAPMTAIAADAFFAHRRFDWLIVDDADLLSAADLLALAERADRWILAARPPVPSAKPIALPPTATANLNGRETEESPFARLWRSLHCDPRHLPYQWIEEGGHLTCRLESVPAEERFRLEREPVADQPEVELRIWAPPHAAPRLAEVVFPAGEYPIAKAKHFLYRQLEELAIRPESACVRWSNVNGHVRFEASRPGEYGAEQAISLEEGVREIVHAAAPNGQKSSAVYWSTARLEFDVAAGWDQVRAAEWLWNRARLRDWGRTSYLHVPYRAHPELAQFASAVLGEGHAIETAPRTPPADAYRHAGLITPGAHFVPLTSHPRNPAKPALKTSTSVNPKPSANGPPRVVIAGELTLEDPRQRAQLPPELQNRLPAQGTVHFGEAQAMIAKLESFRHPPVGGAVKEAGPLRVAVLIGHAAQAQLFAALWEKSSADKSFLDLRIATPFEFRGREADLVLLSLRVIDGKDAQGAHRGEDCRTAFTAARTALLLFGDPSSLARHGHGKPPNDRVSRHVSGDSGVPSRLLKYLEDLERHPRAIPAREEIVA